MQIQRIGLFFFAYCATLFQTSDIKTRLVFGQSGHPPTLRFLGSLNLSGMKYLGIGKSEKVNGQYAE